MKPEALGALLECERAKANKKLLQDIAVSMASFIAAIDQNSIDVARYIEQRLGPLVSLLEVDFRVREAIVRIAADARRLL